MEIYTFVIMPIGLNVFSHFYFFSIFTVEEKTPFTTKVTKVETGNNVTPRTRGKDTFAKKSGVTKIGNNTYYYTGTLFIRIFALAVEW